MAEFELLCFTWLLLSLSVCRGVSRICLTSGLLLCSCCVGAFPVQSVLVYGFCRKKLCIRYFNNMILIYFFLVLLIYMFVLVLLFYSYNRYIRLVQTDKTEVVEHINQDHIIKLQDTQITSVKTRNAQTISSRLFFLLTRPTNMEEVEYSETSAHKIQTQGYHSKERINTTFRTRR
jgi:hypothetical protein